MKATTTEQLKTTTGIVLKLLFEQPETRNSDNILYYWVIKTIAEKKHIDITKMSVLTYFLNLKQFGFPAFETVRRSRQKIQEQYPELAGNAAVSDARAVKERAFKEYARGNV